MRTDNRLVIGRADIPPDEAVYLLTASGYYGLTNDRLKILCSKQIIQKLNRYALIGYRRCRDTYTNLRENLLRVLEAASDVGAKQLKDFVLAEVVKDFVHLMRTKADQVSQLPKSLLIDIMSALAYALASSSTSTPIAASLPFLTSLVPSSSSSTVASSLASNSVDVSKSGL